MQGEETHHGRAPGRRGRRGGRGHGGGAGRRRSVLAPAWQPVRDAAGTAAECATVDVPIDRARPELGSARLALARLPALDPGRRIGSLLVNPGGPGGSGVGFVQFGGLASPDLARLRQRFDSWASTRAATGSARHASRVTRRRCSTRRSTGSRRRGRGSTRWSRTTGGGRGLPGPDRAAAGERGHAERGRRHRDDPRRRSASRRSRGWASLTAPSWARSTRRSTPAGCGRWCSTARSTTRGRCARRSSRRPRPPRTRWSVSRTGAAARPAAPCVGRDVLRFYDDVVARAAHGAIWSSDLGRPATADEVSAGVYDHLYLRDEWPALGKALAAAGGEFPDAGADRAEPVPVPDLRAYRAIGCHDFPSPFTGPADMGVMARLVRVVAPHSWRYSEYWDFASGCTGWPVPAKNPPQPHPVQGPSPSWSWRPPRPGNAAVLGPGLTRASTARPC